MYHPGDERPHMPGLKQFSYRIPGVQNHVTTKTLGTSGKLTFFKYAKGHLLKIYQFYNAKNTPRDTHKTRKAFSPNWRLSTFEERKIENFFFEISQNFFDGLRLVA